MKPAFLAAVLFLAGCAHVGKQAARTPLPAAASADQLIPVGSTVGSPPAAYPAEYEEYYVGMIPDDDDPNFAYRPGGLIVQTRPARFRFDGQSGIAPVFDQGPATFARMANDHPEPTETELAAMVARSQRVISALTEENQDLLAQVRENPAGPPATRAQASADAAANPPSKSQTGAIPAAGSEDGRLNVIAPNDDYVIALDPNLFVAPAPTTTNPFVQLYQPPVAWRELAIQVSAAVPGPKPTAIIDGDPYSVGDRYKDLTVYRVEADTVYLRKDSFLLACPVSERTLKLRLP
jgi:hypothetical protein